MEIYARDWIKNKKYVTELQTLIAHRFKFYPSPYHHCPSPLPPPTNVGPVQCFFVMYVMSFPRANIGRWGRWRGENIAIFLMLISTSRVEQLCFSLSQTNYSMIVGPT